MKLAREGEAPILEHNHEFIFLTEEQFDKLKTLTPRTVKDYLCEFLMPSLKTASERSILEKWVNDDTIGSDFNSIQQSE